MTGIDALGLFLALVVYGLVTFRVTSFFVRESGPFSVFARIRDLAGIKYDDYSRPVAKNPIAEMLNCFKCASVWAAWLVVGLRLYDPDPLTYITRILVLSAIAILIDAKVH